MFSPGLIFFGAYWTLEVSDLHNFKVLEYSRGELVIGDITGGKTGSSKSTCALLFFGLLRSPEMALGSIEDYVIKPNWDCDIYVHTYNITDFTSRRSGEIRAKVNSTMAYQLLHGNTATSAARNGKIVMDSMNQFQEAHNVSYYRKYFPEKQGWDYPSSVDNMIKQWHSIQRAWDVMESSGTTYRRVGLFRLDLLYMHPISILHGNATIPYFANWVRTNGKYRQMNDRMFYGNYEYAKIWASTRFSSVPEYLSHTENLKIGLHSESYLAWLFRNVKMESKPLCSRRIRSNGSIKSTDCMTHEEMLDKALKYAALPQSTPAQSPESQYTNTTTTMQYQALPALKFPADLQFPGDGHIPHYGICPGDKNRPKEKLVYLRDEKAIIEKNRPFVDPGRCTNSLNVLAWVMNEINKRNQTMMIAYGGLIHIFRENDFVEPDGNNYIDDDFDMWVTPESFETLIDLEPTIWEKFSWTIRIFSNCNKDTVFAQVIAACGHKYNQQPWKAVSSFPAFELYTLHTMRIDPTTTRDNWQGGKIPTSLLYPPKHLPFTSKATKKTLHLQIPAHSEDIMRCIYGNWSQPSRKKGGPPSNKKDTCMMQAAQKVLTSSVD